jgi:hypothetical protein
MSNATGGSGTGVKKETVYGGPGPNTNGGTVYNGPASGGTVYQGPGLSGVQGRSPATRAVQAAPKTGGARGGVIFFTIAGFSALNTVLMLAKAPFVLAIGLAITRMRVDGQLGPVLVMNAIAIGVFVVLGIVTGKGSKAAFLIGFLLYGADTALLLLSGNAGLHVSSIVVHGLFLFYLVKAFRQIEG